MVHQAVVALEHERPGDDGGVDRQRVRGEEEGAQDAAAAEVVLHEDGGGGADILVWDFADLNIDGGGNTDTLRVDAGDVDIASFSGAISGIDHIDLETDTGANILTLSYADVLDMTDNSDTLVIDGDGGDSVDAGAGWTDGGVSGGYHTYTQGSGPNTATLQIDTDIVNVLV